MRVTYAFKMQAVCPVDKKKDVYEVEVISDRTIPVEDILRLTKDQPEAFQETLTENLARLLGAKVISTGWHSGVKTVCEA
tara:strand:- start:953 stop:1192 length:240 start_codon:yes stop_codon:yes gene_type:complete